MDEKEQYETVQKSTLKSYLGYTIISEPLCIPDEIKKEIKVIYIFKKYKAKPYLLNELDEYYPLWRTDENKIKEEIKNEENMEIKPLEHPRVIQEIKKMNLSMDKITIQELPKKKLKTGYKRIFIIKEKD